jgi:cobalt-zinc-cadmium efflux system membrane fusion protein
VVQAGQTQAFTISDLSTVWVLANVYQADLPMSAAAKTSLCRPTRIPAASRRKDLLCLAGARSKHPNPAGAHRGGQSRRKAEERYVLHGHGDGRQSLQNAIAVPNASVLRDDNNQPFVYVAVGANQFGRRDVEIGESEDG